MNYIKYSICLLIIFFLFVFLTPIVFAATPTYQSAPTASEVLVVYNSSYTTDSDTDGTQDSLEIADYYKTKRSIPDANVLGISAPTTEEITRTQYNDQIKAALESYLTSSGLKTSIKYIVLTKGIPLKIQATNGAAYGVTNYSSVDAAVCLLYETYDTTWRLDNPYYNADFSYTKAYRFDTEHFSTSGVYLRYLVTRLDGYTVANIKTMIDKGFAPDTSGAGYWIIDDHLKSYDYMSTAWTNLNGLSQNLNPNPWSDTTNFIITNPSGSVIGYTSHGIHAGMIDGYVTSTLSFTYLAGAVFSTYESFNAYGFVSASQSTHGQVAEFIQSGGSGGIGNVYEPWASSIAHENIFMPQYAIGYPWADAAYQSLAYLDFVSVVVGDPLMTIREITAPAEVSNLSATAGDNQVALTWTNPVDADFAGVKILRKTDSYPGHSADGTVVYNSTGTSYTNTGLTNGTIYYYTAFAYDEVPNYSPGSAAGAKGSATPAAPSDTTAPSNITSFQAIAGLNQVTLSWTNPGDTDLAGVKILRKTTGYPANPTDGTVAFNNSASSFIDSSVSGGTTYYYTAFAYDEVPNYSAAVAGAQGTATPSTPSPPPIPPDTVLPGKPISFSATPGNSQVGLSWTNPSDDDFSGVKILRRTDYYPISPTNGTVVYQGAGASYTDTGLTNSTTYFYRIFTFDKVNNFSVIDSTVRAVATPYSGSPVADASAGDGPSTAFTTPDSTTPDNIASMAAAVSAGQIVLTWTDPFNDDDWKGTKLVRKTGGYSASPTDGTIVYNGTAGNYTDTSIQAGTTYYYTAFAYDDSRNYSDGTVSGARASALAQ